MSKTEQLASNIVATVATAEAVLAHFEKSLLDAGFAEGSASYVQLADTLVGQKLWADTSGMAPGARFGAVAAHAQAIHALLLPYVDAFQRLSALALPTLLDDVPASEAPAADDDPVAHGLLTAIDNAGRPLSTSALRAELRVSKAELTEAVDRLVDAGHVERRHSSGRELIARRADS